MSNNDDTTPALPLLLAPPVIRSPQEFAYGEISPNRFLSLPRTTVIAAEIYSPPDTRRQKAPSPIPVLKQKNSRTPSFSSSYPPQDSSTFERPRRKPKSKNVKWISPKDSDNEEVKDATSNVELEEGTGDAQKAEEGTGDKEAEPTKKHKKKERKFRRKLELVLPDMSAASYLLTSPFKKKKPSRSLSVDSGRVRLSENTSDPTLSSPVIAEDSISTDIHLSVPATPIQIRQHRSNPNIRSTGANSSMEKLSAMAEMLSFGIIKSPRRHSTGSILSPPETSDSELDVSEDEGGFSSAGSRGRSAQAILEFEMSPLPDVELLGRKDDVKHTFTPQMAELVREHLPARLRLAEQWRLLYSMEQHGTSLSTLYKSVVGKWVLVIAVKDTEGNVFGAFVPEVLKPRVGYYGNGECFLWMIITSEGRTTGLRVYPWTGKNDYFMISEADYFGIGGGNGKFGLYLDSSFIKGSSAPCPTFDNASLTGNKEEFECAEIEVWGIPLNAYLP